VGLVDLIIVVNQKMIGAGFGGQHRIAPQPWKVFSTAASIAASEAGRPLARLPPRLAYW
jgi:hypothetical protein